MNYSSSITQDRKPLNPSCLSSACSGRGCCTDPREAVSPGKGMRGQIGSAWAARYVAGTFADSPGDVEKPGSVTATCCVAGASGLPPPRHHRTHPLQGDLGTFLRNEPDVARITRLVELLDVPKLARPFIVLPSSAAGCLSVAAGFRAA